MNLILRIILTHLLLVLAAVGQSAPTQQRSQPATRPLSSYMREMGLQYIETVEAAFDEESHISDNYRRLDREPALYKSTRAIQDRIEMHISSRVDKDFLDVLTDLPWQARSAAFGLWNSPTDHHEIDTYIACRDALRQAVKAGAYSPSTLYAPCHHTKPKPKAAK